jgi:membrane protein
VELREALNSIWHVPAVAHATRFGGVFMIVRERFYSLGLILIAGFLLLVSLVLNTWLAAMGKFFRSHLPTPEFVLQAGGFLISLVAITLIFAGIYKMLPDVPLVWNDAIVGASATAFLFTIGKQLIAFYLGKTTLSSTYGAAGSFALVLVWVYYSAQIFFLGAEFTKVYTRTRRSTASRQ